MHHKSLISPSILQAEHVLIALAEH